MTKHRPNILLLFTDQQRFDTIHALGNPVIQTPHLDRLTRMGTAFTSAYTCSPVCVSARCSLTLGQYPMNSGCYSNDMGMPPQGRQTFMQMLTEAGYRTHGIGKMHFKPDLLAPMGLESREISEEFCPADKDDYVKYVYRQGYDYVVDPHGTRGDMYYIPQISPYPARLHPTQWVGDRTCRFLDEQAGSTRPWFCWSSFIHPHPPFNPPYPWNFLYQAAMMPLPKLPPDYEALQTYINKLQNRRKYRSHGMDLDVLRVMKSYYYACISFIDYQVGRIMDALEKTGQLENTLILFSTDHGEHMGDYNCFGKRSFHDSCARIPMLAAWPGVFQAGARCDEPCSLIDIASTCMEAAETDFSDHKADGMSLMDRAAGKGGAVFSQHESGDLATYMVVNKRWKLWYSAPDNQEWFFDRVQDPEETRSRAGVVFLKDYQEQMRRQLMEHLASGNETGNIESLEKGTWRKTPKMDLDLNPDTGLRTVMYGWCPHPVDIPGYPRQQRIS